MFGDLFVGGKRPSVSFIRRNTAYAEQDNALIGNLTVRDFLMYTAQLKNDMHEARSEKESRVNDLISGLGLDNCANTIIGNELTKGISGGQAKRVSVAAQLCTEPAVLFLDEPTSGLDSYSAHETMTLVRRYCKDRGVSVISTIHSPSARTLGMFDQMLLLLEGRQIYFGSIKTEDAKGSLISFMQACLPSPPEFSRFDNPAEFVVNTSTSAVKRREAHYFIDGYDKSDLKRQNDALVERCLKEYREMNAAESSPETHKAEVSSSAVIRRTVSHSYSKQALDTTVQHYDEDDVDKALSEEHTGLDDFIGPAALQEPHINQQKYAGGTRTPVYWALITMLAYRTSANFRDSTFLGARLTEKAVQGFIIATLYAGVGGKEDRTALIDTAAMLFVASILPAFGAAAYIPAISGEKRTTYREFDDALFTPLSYLIFKILEEMLVAAIAAVIFTLLLFYPLELDGNYGLVFLVYFTVLLIGITLAYAIAAATPTDTAANATLPIYVVSLLFFCGFLRNFDNIPPGWQWYVPGEYALAKTVEVRVLYNEHSVSMPIYRYSRIDFIRYAWTSLMIGILVEGKDDPILVSSNAKQSTRVSEFYNLPNVRAFEQYGILWAFFVVFFTAAWASLRFIRHQLR
jgi:ABC-type multidrug transport system ATPase subunit